MSDILSEWNVYINSTDKSCFVLFRQSGEKWESKTNKEMPYKIIKCVDDKFIILMKGGGKNNWEERFDLRKEDMDKFKLQIFSQHTTASKPND